MPIKSMAQRAKLQQLVAEGKMTQDEFNRLDGQTKGALPNRLTLKKPVTSVDDITQYRKDKFGE